MKKYTGRILDRFGEELYDRHLVEKDPGRQAGLMTQFIGNLDAISCMTYPLPDTEEECIEDRGQEQVHYDIIEGIRACLDGSVLKLKKSERQCLEQVIEEYESEPGLESEGGSSNGSGYP